MPRSTLQARRAAAVASTPNCSASGQQRVGTLIVYQSTKSDFLDTVFKRDIEAVILAAFRKRVGHGVSRNELRSWKESLLAMAKVLNDDCIPCECGVAVEYGIPQTSKRI